jgi:hypothetical protein
VSLIRNIGLSHFFYVYLFIFICLSHSASPFFDGLFRDRVSRTISLGLASNCDPPDLSQIARIRGMSHQCLDYLYFKLPRLSFWRTSPLSSCSSLYQLNSPQLDTLLDLLTLSVLSSFVLLDYILTDLSKKRLCAK